MAELKEKKRTSTAKTKKPSPSVTKTKTAGSAKISRTKKSTASDNKAKGTSSKKVIKADVAKNKAAPKKSAQNKLEAKKKPNNSTKPKKDNAKALENEKPQPPVETDVNIAQQTASSVLFVVAAVMFFLIITPSESLWNVIRGFIFGLFGPFAFLWDALLFYIAFLLAKQKNQMLILERARFCSFTLVLIDAFSYVMFVSDGYRDTQNRISGGYFSLLKNAYLNAGQKSGTGLLGVLVGEICRALGGKPGACIILFLMVILMVMLVTHTTPVKFMNNTKYAFANFIYKCKVFADEFFTYVHEEDDYVEEYNPDDEYEIDDGSYEVVEAEADDEPIEPDKPQLNILDKLAKHTNTEDLPQEKNQEHKEEKASSQLDELINKVSLKKKKSKADEIQEKQDEFAKEVDNADDCTESEYLYPSINLLIEPKHVNETNDQAELREMAEQLIDTLEEYGVKASISDISRGPTVTRYELKPAPGVKIKKITELANDIALRLAAKSIRIEAPIPGKPAVGIEVPNQTKQMVRIREILGSSVFAEAKGSLTVALGKDIEGNLILCDLSKMPHLLIAGSTGSGKSVCVNTMLMSILYKYSPQEVRMVLIDPKSVEFDMYNGIPHLLVPVVCDPKKAAGALQWAVSEMLKRYGMLKERGVRNIDNYNKLAEQSGEFPKLCRIVIVIDEMADLMIASPKEVEAAIARLAAMARAAGMYMVLATQRPSVDVITGTIKNNIPSRIALMVSSQIDSRTILDTAGAENLIGYGDMLYHPMGSSKSLRVQGCFVEDSEVLKVINFVKQNGNADYDESITDEIERNSIDSSGEGTADFVGKDPLFMSAVEIVTEAGQASVSMLQRRLSVGYARAGKLIDQLEENGVVGPHEGSKPRAVLITHAQWLEMTMNHVPSGKDDPIVRSHSEFASQTLDAGHEEISARQAEFFNSEEEDEPNDSTESIPNEEVISSSRDLTEFFDDDEDIDSKQDNSDIPPWEDESSDNNNSSDEDDAYYLPWTRF